MTPSAFLSNQITFRVIGTCFSVQQKARKLNISPAKVLRRQSALRANFHESLFLSSEEKYNITPKLWVYTEGAFKHYFVFAVHGKTLVVGFGYSAKDAYKNFYQYLRSDGLRYDVVSRARADLQTFLFDKAEYVVKSTPDLMTSDILAPKYGRIVN